MNDLPRTIMVKRLDGAVFMSTEDKIPSLLTQWGSDRICVIAWNTDPIYYSLMDQLKQGSGS